MATITVRDLDESTRAKLRIRAARNGRSMEAEVREILTTAISDESVPFAPLGTHIRELVAQHGGADELIPHLPPRVDDGLHRVPDFTHPKYGAVEE